MNKNKVYSVILNWNNYRDTIECVHSIQKTTYPNYEIVIVDNGSADDSQKILEKEFPKIKLIQTGKNLGFAGGNNQGIKYALERGADLVWVLNPDTIVASDTLGKMVQGISKNDVGIVAPKIYYYDFPNKVWFVGSLLSLKTGRAEHVRYGEIDKGQFDKELCLKWAPGTSLLIKKEVFEKVGFFDEKYFLFYEDVDFCVRARKTGFKIRFSPEAKIWHKVGSTVGRRNPDNEYYKTRNRLYFVKKFNQAFFGVVFSMLFGLKLGTRVVKSKFTGANKEFVQADWEGFWDFLNNHYGIKN